MIGHKTEKLFAKEVVTMMYDDFCEYSDHLQIMESRGYSPTAMIENPNNEARMVKYERVRSIKEL